MMVISDDFVLAAAHGVFVSVIFVEVSVWGSVLKPAVSFQTKVLEKWPLPVDLINFISPHREFNLSHPKMNHLWKLIMSVIALFLFSVLYFSHT